VLPYSKARVGPGRHYARPSSRREFVRVRRSFFVVRTVTAPSAMSLVAQTFGEVTGRISDSTGPALPGAKVYLTNTAASAIRKTRSTDSGDIPSPPLRPAYTRSGWSKPLSKSRAAATFRSKCSKLSIPDSTGTSDAMDSTPKSTSSSARPAASTKRCSSALRRST
jgi:hypothetical protein